MSHLHLAERGLELVSNEANWLAKRLLAAALVMALLPLPAAFLAAKASRPHAGQLRSVPCSAEYPCPFYISGVRVSQVVRLP